MVSPVLFSDEIGKKYLLHFANKKNKKYIQVMLVFSHMRLQLISLQ